ncbi:hypothetical protein F4801DRAFT_142919 [Xylaria longipes]|nr:hypothetical protein F4801DRAFT_142919 [Xylaria longipes]
MCQCVSFRPQNKRQISLNPSAQISSRPCSVWERNKSFLQFVPDLVLLLSLGNASFLGRGGNLLVVIFMVLLLMDFFLLLFAFTLRRASGTRATRRGRARAGAGAGSSRGRGLSGSSGGDYLKSSVDDLKRVRILVLESLLSKFRPSLAVELLQSAYLKVHSWGNVITLPDAGPLWHAELVITILSMIWECFGEREKLLRQGSSRERSYFTPKATTTRRK